MYTFLILVVGIFIIASFIAQSVNSRVHGAFDFGALVGVILMVITTVSLAFLVNSDEIPMEETKAFKAGVEMGSAGLAAEVTTYECVLTPTKEMKIVTTVPEQE